MKNEKFLKSLLTIESTEQKEKREKEKQEKENKKTIKKEIKKIFKESEKGTLGTIKEKNQKWFWISLFSTVSTKEKNFLIEYVREKEKVSKKIKSDLIKEIEKGTIKDIDTIENCLNVLTLENKIEKEQKTDGLFAIELENQINLYIENISWNITSSILEKNIKKGNKKINIFFLISNAMQKLKYQEQKKNEKYEDVNNNFFGVDESKNNINIVSEQYNHKYIIEQLQKQKEREKFKTLYDSIEEKKEQFKKEVNDLKEKIKEKVKEIEKRLENGENKKDIDTTEIIKMKKEIEEIQKKRNIEKTSENRTIKNIIKNRELEKYL